MIKFEHVYKTYEGPTHALRNVELLINKGEFVFLTGASGAGKSTIFRMISAYDVPTSGIVTICEQKTSQLTGDRLAFFRRRIGVVFQDFKLLKDRSIFENVALPLQVMGDRPQVIQKKVFDLLDRVGLIYKKDNLPSQLSGGEQQRVAIARALIHQPGVLIADEPTGNLDPELSEEIMDIFEEVNAQGTTVFIATHDHGMVKSRKKRVLKIKDGMLLKDEVLNERFLERL